MEFMNESSIDNSKRYKFISRLGQGAFGEVHLCVDTLNDKYVAIKNVRIVSRDVGIPVAVFREMESLRQLSSSGLVTELLDVYPDEKNLCLVLEYLPSDLSEIIIQSKEYLSRPQIKSISLMLLEAISFCHQNNIIHRDIKPANILISSSGKLKLGDFGLARIYDPIKYGSMSHQVSTRWYRAPELLFASRNYTQAVDIWSAGTVIAELILLTPIFPGNNDIDQMFRVFQIMGTPTSEIWPGVDPLPDYSKIFFPNMKPIDFNIILPNAHIKDIEFLKLLLVLDPNKRITANNAINNNYFLEYPLPCSYNDIPILKRNNNNNKRNIIKNENDITIELEKQLMH